MYEFAVSNSNNVYNRQRPMNVPTIWTLSAQARGGNSGPKPVPDDLVHHSEEALGRFVFRQLQELCDPRVGELVLGE